MNRVQFLTIACLLALGILAFVVLALRLSATVPLEFLAVPLALIAVLRELSKHP